MYFKYGFIFTTNGAFDANNIARMFRQQFPDNIE